MLPIYFAAGIISPYPDTPWIGEVVANNGTAELRTLGFAIIKTAEQPPRGLCDVQIRASSRLELVADTDCQLDAFHCLRPLDFVPNPPTWNQYDPAANLSWSNPGGEGGGDSTPIGSVYLTANVPGNITGSALVDVLTAMTTGSQQNFMVRRNDAGYETVTIGGTLVIEFDLVGPPS